MTQHWQGGTTPPAPGRNAWQRLPTWEKALIIVSAVIPIGIIGGALGAGDPAQDTAGDSERDAGAEPQKAQETEGAPEEPKDAGDAGDTGGGEEASLPDLTGSGLQAAQDAAQAAGFSYLTSHDASGRDREQIWDRNWQVCFQLPASGTHATDTEIDFGVVALDEECPARDEAAGKGPESADGTMPDLVGESANVARDALPGDASITVRDVSGQERLVILESNWQVCAQAPEAGAALDGQPVTLEVVKFEEGCP